MSEEGSARVRVSYAIVFVSDMERSVAFYRDTIGLPAIPITFRRDAAAPRS